MVEGLEIELLTFLSSTFFRFDSCSKLESSETNTEAVISSRNKCEFKLRASGLGTIVQASYQWLIGMVEPHLKHESTSTLTQMGIKLPAGQPL